MGYAYQPCSGACADEPLTKAAFGAESQGGKVDYGGAPAPGGERYSLDEDPALLDQFARQVRRAAGKAIRSIDHTLSLVAESERRIQQLARAAFHRG